MPLIHKLQMEKTPAVYVSREGREAGEGKYFSPSFPSRSSRDIFWSAVFGGHDYNSHT